MLEGFQIIIIILYHYKNENRQKTETVKIIRNLCPLTELLLLLREPLFRKFVKSSFD